jgi:undecaprenyl diphosphate synthase
MHKLYDIKDFIETKNRSGVEHLAVIMDGNGRWAARRGMPRWKGHEMGVRAVKRLAESACKFEIPVVTVFAFSSENWKRPEREVRLLFGLFLRYFKTEHANLLKEGIRVSVFGRRDRVPGPVLDAIELLERDTAGCDRLHLRIALDYGARQEILEAVRRLVRDGVRGNIDPEHIDEEYFSGLLSTAGMTDPDLVIRTAGERRLSNFLLWQTAYSELYFCRKFWPDFEEADLAAALEDFHSRTRKYGGLIDRSSDVPRTPGMSEASWEEDEILSSLATEAVQAEKTR